MSICDRSRLMGMRRFISGGSRGLEWEMAIAITDAGAINHPDVSNDPASTSRWGDFVQLEDLGLLAVYLASNDSTARPW